MKGFRISITVEFASAVFVCLKEVRRHGKRGIHKELSRIAGVLTKARTETDEV